MSKHSLAPGFVLQRLDDKGRARWELNRPAEEERRKKKGQQRTGGEEWGMADLGSEWELGEGDWEERRPSWKYWKWKFLLKKNN